MVRDHPSVAVLHIGEAVTCRDGLGLAVLGVRKRIISPVDRGVSVHTDQLFAQRDLGLWPVLRKSTRCTKKGTLCFHALCQSIRRSRLMPARRRRSPKTTVTMLTTAPDVLKPSNGSLSSGLSLERPGKIVGREQLLDHPGRAVPVEGAEAVARGDETRSGVQHFVLGVARAEFRADSVPRSLQKFHLTLRAHRRRALGLVDDRPELRIGEIQY